MSVKGIKDAQRNLRAYQKRVRGAVGKALHAEGQAIMREAKKEVPVDTGRLRQTGFVGRAVDGPKGPTVPIGFGTKYALPVHERLEVHHPVGKAKYLEDPVNRAKKGFPARIASRVKRMLGGAR